MQLTLSVSFILPVAFIISESEAMKLALLLTILLATGTDFMQNMSTH